MSLTATARQTLESKLLEDEIYPLNVTPGDIDLFKLRSNDHSGSHLDHAQ